jgi:hypothetical protein
MAVTIWSVISLASLRCLARPLRLPLRQAASFWSGVVFTMLTLFRGRSPVTARMGALTGMSSDRPQAKHFFGVVCTQSWTDHNSSAAIQPALLRVSLAIRLLYATTADAGACPRVFDPTMRPGRSAPGRWLAAGGVPNRASCAGSSRHAVVAGDTLLGVAENSYGEGNLWPRLFTANRDRISEPNPIQVGQVLRIPFEGPKTPLRCFRRAPAASVGRPGVRSSSGKGIEGSPVAVTGITGATTADRARWSRKCQRWGRRRRWGSRAHSATVEGAAGQRA